MTGALTFTPHDHANTDSYEARLYAQGTTTPLIDTLDLGKPDPDEFGTITVDLSSWLGGQADGNYEVHVAAINGDGETESDESNAFTVPLSEE